MTTFVAKLTNAGLALYTSAISSGVAVQLTQIAVGDGNGIPTTPDPAQTALVHEVYRGNISAKFVDGTDPTLVFCELVIPAAQGGWTIREVGIYNNAGTLFAIANFPETYKPVVSDGSTRDLVIRFGLKLSNSSAVTVTIDPNIVTATRAWVLSTITPAYILPGGTVGQVLTKLSSTAGDFDWVDPRASSTISTTGGSRILTVTEYTSKFIFITGVLTSNSTIIFPTSIRDWVVINQTTGAFTVTCKTTSGTGVVVIQNGIDAVVGDGVNISYMLRDAITQSFGDSTTSSATTAFVQRAVSYIGGYYQDTGSANAYVVTTVPVTTSYVTGMSFRIRIANNNTSGSTLNAGAGVKPLLREDGSALQSGDVRGLITVVYDASIGSGSWLMAGLAISELGAIAQLNIGQGLENDGSGNLRVKLADTSIRRTATGIQKNMPITTFSGALSVTSASNGTMLVSTSTGTITVPQTTTTWNGFSFSVFALGGNVVVTPNASDKINLGTAGASYTVLSGTSACFVGDGVSNIDVFYQTAVPGLSPAPQYINSSQSINTGQYNVDTSVAAVSLTLPSSPATGTCVVLGDAQFTWGRNNVTLINGGGGNTIEGSSANFTLDVSGICVMLIYKSGNWSFQQ